MNELDQLRHSVFRNVREIEPFASSTVSRLGEDFRSNDRIRAMVEKARASDDYGSAKRELPAFTPAGLFSRRNAGGLISHMGRIVIDIDGLESLDEARRLRDEIAERESTCMAFVSPSGLGVKSIVGIWPIPRSADQHTAAWLQIARLYERRFGFPVDQSGKDVSRLCFVTHDPEAYSNWWHGMIDWDDRPPRRRGQREFDIEAIPGVIELRSLAGDAEAAHIPPMARAITGIKARNRWDADAERRMIEIGEEVHLDPSAHDWKSLVPRFAAGSNV